MLEHQLEDKTQPPGQPRQQPASRGSDAGPNEGQQSQVEKYRISVLRIIFVLYGLLALAYSLLMPPWEAPDETAHYLVVLSLALEGRMPTLEETYEAAQPPPYYWLASQLFRLLNRFEPALIAPYRSPLTQERALLTRYDWTAENYRFLWGMQLLRWFNIPLGGLALVFIYKGVQRLMKMATTAEEPAEWPLSILPVATVALVGMLPQFLYNSASLSNDPLANAAGAFLFWMLAVVSAGELGVGQLLLAIIAALVFPVAIKLTILPMSLAVLAAAFGQAWRRYRVYRPWFVGGSILLGLLLPGILLWLAPATADFFWRNIRLRLTYIRPDAFSGWPFWNVVTFYVTSYWGQVGWKDAGLPPVVVTSLMSLAFLGWLTSLRLLWPRHAGHRFWSLLLPAFSLLVLGWLALYRHDAWWRMPWSILACFLVLILFAWRRYGRTDPARWLALDRSGWSAVWLAAGLTLVVILKNALTTTQYQGRFLFPSLGALTLLMTAGWYALLPRRFVPYLPIMIVLLFLGLNFLLWFTQVLPVYYQPFLDGNW